MEKVDRIDRYTKLLDEILKYFSIFMIIISVTLAFLNMVFRYFFGISYEVWTEISTYSIIYGVFAYLGPLIKQGEHIKMDMLHEVLSKKILTYLDVFINLLLVASFSVLTYAGVHWVDSLIQMNTKTLSGGIYLYIPALAVVIGMALGIVYASLELVKSVILIKNGKKE
ncbi:MAG TPA: TRAP transporter small permease [Pseudogracilibacillus sp.]|nr:TRAP transporter small permease [Pseudogracilibacillus sp.]